MEYKRSESFRHILKNDMDVHYSFTVNDVAMTKVAKIIDISPSGISIVTTEAFTEAQLKSVITFSFTIHSKEIKTIGFIRWKKHHIDGFQYGVDLDTDETMEKIIIEELKLRRKQEVLEQKTKN